MNHYETLGIPADADAETIKAGYRETMKRNHPDKGGNDEKAAAANLAYEVLSDPEKRRAYDRGERDAATKAACQLWEQIIESQQPQRDLVKFAREKIAELKADIERQKRSLTKAIAQLQDIADRLSAAPTLQACTQAKIAQKQDALQSLNESTATLAAVEAIFLDAQYRADPPPQYGGSHLFTASTLANATTIMRGA